MRAWSCAYMSLCVFMWVCACGDQSAASCDGSSPSSLLKMASIVGYNCALQACWPPSFWGPSCLQLPSLRRSTGLQIRVTVSGFM